MTTNVGLSFRFRKARAMGDGSHGPRARWRPDEIGNGSYATVYRVEEIIDSGTTQEGDRKAVRRPAVAKICKDDPPKDALVVFSKEVEVLSELANLDDVISLRGVVDALPPTFVCGAEDCDDPDKGVFSVTECPRCRKQGVRGSSLMNGDKTSTLQCSVNPEHMFAKHNVGEFRELTRDRPCGHHEAPVSEINFTFRPCILLDELDVNLDEFVRLQDGAHIRGLQLPTIPREGRTDEDAYEILIQRLYCLTRVARGLAEVHQRGRAHLDLHPSNVMLRISQSSDPVSARLRLGRLNEYHTRLIDFGKSRPLVGRETTEDIMAFHEARTRGDTVVPDGRGVVYSAPEQSVPTDRIDVTWLHPWHTDPEIECDEEGILWIEPGDILRDHDKGQYRVLSVRREEVTNGRGERSYVRRAKLQVIVKPSRANRTDPAQVEWWRAPSEASDIYSLGSVICWLITGGRRETLNNLQANLRAHTRAIRSPNVDFDAWVPDKVDRDKAFEHVGLPLYDPHAEHINRQLFRAIMRCWHRGEHGFYAGRSQVGTGAAARVASELNDIREQAIMIHRQLRLGSPLAEVGTNELMDRLKQEASEAALLRKELQVFKKEAERSILAASEELEAARDEAARRAQEAEELVRRLEQVSADRAARIRELAEARGEVEDVRQEARAVEKEVEDARRSASEAAALVQRLQEEVEKANGRKWAAVQEAREQSEEQWKKLVEEKEARLNQVLEEGGREKTRLREELVLAGRSLTAVRVLFYVTVVGVLGTAIHLRDWF